MPVLNDNKNLIACGFTLLILTACTDGGSLPVTDPGPPGSAANGQTLKIPDSIQDQNDNEEDAITVQQTLAIPPAFDNSTDSTPSSSNTQFKSVNLDGLFSEKLKDSEARIDRLENVVLDFRREFEGLKPAILRLSAIEDDMQMLLAELEGFVENAMTAEAPPNPVQPEQTDQKTIDDFQPNPVILDEEPPASAPSGKVESPAMVPGVRLADIRTGQHPDKIRLVFDVTDSFDYDVDIDNENKVLRVIFPGLGALADLKAERSFATFPLLDSYTLTANEEGVSVAFALERASRLLAKERLGSTDEYRYHRLVLDLGL